MSPFAAAFKVSPRLVVAILALLLGTLRLRADTITFPSGFVPLTSVEYVSAPDPSGVRLILGYSTFPAFATILFLPSPSYDNQQFADSAIELAPGQFFSNVYVPTLAERDGDFRDFGGPVFDPFSGQYFAQNIIPTSLLGGIYAFRVGASAPVPDPRPFYTLPLGAAAVVITLLLRQRTKNAPLL